MKPKAYRSVLRLSFMGKVVEKVAAELLSEETETRGLLGDRYFASNR
jgi:hypothetical protein